MPASHLLRGLFALLAAALVLGGVQCAADTETATRAVVTSGDSLIWG
ncbi:MULTISPECIES: hypothetical protein [Streptomyces]|nr:hypothetical protein [Streptomyces indiaensis]MCF1644687.1 hypothetical protein [Streptomyces indiaensis]